MCHEISVYPFPPVAIFNNPEIKGFENIVGGGGNVVYQHFLLFQRCFLT